MATPNTAGYYGLELPDPLEAEIESLGKQEILSLISDISLFLFVYSHRPSDDRPSFLSKDLTEHSDEHLDTLETEQFISLMKWLCDLLDHLLPKA